jgi:hypothetical protein
LPPATTPLLLGESAARPADLAAPEEFFFRPAGDGISLAAVTRDQVS